ncbi:MAG: hypothetical protein E7286_04660 [Lachnospiraceae bacterium]|nr:hypothetical protein [Lachnospiraceae bacterium]
MRHYDEELRELQIQAAAKNRLETVIKELGQQKSILETRVEELSARKAKEQLDVERLEKNSLVNYFYQVVGKLDDKLTKERQEAYEAAVKYDTAYSELQSIEAELREKELEYGRVRRSNERYQQVLKEKQEALKLSDVPEASEILRLEAQITSLEVQARELEEAISAGHHAERTADWILESLSSAQSWGTFDLLGGGLIADIAKHSHLDEAQGMVERLQEALRRFKTELADVEIIADMQISIDGFLRFADYFFDGLFADWSVMNRISEATGQVEKVKSQIATVLGKLNGASASIKAQKSSAESRLQELVKKITL